MASPADLAADSAFRQIGAYRFRLADLGDADRSEMLRLFSEVFGQPPSTAWRQWKYDEGRGEAVGLWNEDGRLVAHYAGFPRRLLWRGTPIPAIQIGDVMVAAEMRGLLTRKGPFYQVCTRFFDQRVGAGRPFRLAFGFPNERAIRLGIALDLYHDAGVIDQIAWPARSGALPWHWRWAPLDAAAGAIAAADAAWRRMARDFGDGVLGVRDGAFVQHRFCNRPDRQYRLFALRQWPFGGVHAVVVMQLAEGRAELLDVIAPRRLFPLLVQAAAAEAARAGATTLTAWASPAVQQAFASSQPQVVDRVAHLAIAKASLLTAAEVAATPWWWMGGDTDFL